MEQLTNQALQVLITALSLALIIERFVEYFMPVLDSVVGSLASAITHKEYKWEGPAKLAGISVLNAALYAVFFNYNFVGPLVESTTQATVGIWQGHVMSALVVAGGTNLVHQLFKTPEVSRTVN